MSDRNASAANPRQRGALSAVLVGVALLMAWRAPELLRTPRFWAEEGTVYFQAAYHTSFLGGLLHNFREIGYYILGANFATSLAAHAVPLEYAPAVTTSFGFLIQLLPFAVVLWGRSYLWRSPAQKALACLTALFAPMTTSAIWFTSTNIGVWCGFTAFCLLMERVEAARPQAFWAGAALLLFCFLTGAYALFLLPVFALKALVTRERRDAIAVAIAVVAAAVQGCVHFASRAHLDTRRQSLTELNAAEAGLSSFCFHVLGPVMGPEAARELMDELGGKPDQPDGSDGAGLGGGVGALAGLSALFALLWRRPARSLENLAVVAFFAVSALTIAFAFDFRADVRYAALPGLLLGTTLAGRIHLAAGVWRRPRSLVCLLLLATSVTVGIAQYRDWPNLRYQRSSPRWRNEVELWRRDPSHSLRIWPYSERSTRWVIELEPRGS